MYILRLDEGGDEDALHQQVEQIICIIAEVTSTERVPLGLQLLNEI